jgi:hypothetical protein
VPLWWLETKRQLFLVENCGVRKIGVDYVKVSVELFVTRGYFRYLATASRLPQQVDMRGEPGGGNGGTGYMKLNMRQTGGG